ncbi:MAG: HlyD family efflux transporter periplasmic adaptor subunit [Burkholderiales bacterium]
MNTYQFLAAFVIASALGACGSKSEGVYQGYAEGEYVRVAAPFAGSLQKLQVMRGSQVRAGDPLFVLDQVNEAAARSEAEQRVRNADAQLADLKKSRRPSEIDAIKAQLGQARASLKLSTVNLSRQEQLAASNFVSKSVVDEARAATERDRARVTEIEAQVTTSQLTARQDEIRAADSNAAAARAALAQADWKVAQKSVNAPVAGLVNDTNYVAGEWIPAGSPVVSLLPPQNIKVRFFVTEAALGALQAGQQVNVRCDGCAAPVAARVTFISPQAEYTPPVIYSRETRTKLVYLIEARPAPEDAVKLHPGQPVDVTLAKSP